MRVFASKTVYTDFELQNFHDVNLIPRIPNLWAYSVINCFFYKYIFYSDLYYLIMFYSFCIVRCVSKLNA